MKHTPRILVALTLAAAVSPPAPGIDLEITGLDGRAVCGHLVQVVPEIVIATGDGQVAFAWSEVLAARPQKPGLPQTAAVSDYPLRFELADGSVFNGRIGRETDAGVLLEIGAGQSCRLDPASVCAITARVARPAALRELDAIAAGPERGEDVAVVQRGENVAVLHGAVRRITPQAVMFAWKERELPLPWERLAGLRLARPRGQTAPCLVRLYGGEAFGGRVIAGDATGVALQSPLCERLELPWSQIEVVECRSERVAFLSDLAVQRYEFEPFFEKRWDAARDRTLTGRSIRLAGREYKKGLTLHSRSVLSYALDGQYHQFAALVGVADEMDGRGDAAVAVMGDGRMLWQADSIRGGQAPRAVLVDVTGVRELSLHVDFGDQLDLSDHVCWALARVIR